MFQSQGAQSRGMVMERSKASIGGPDKARFQCRCGGPEEHRGRDGSGLALFVCTSCRLRKKRF